MLNTSSHHTINRAPVAPITIVQSNKSTRSMTTSSREAQDAYLSKPVVRPPTRCRWLTKNRMSGGTITRRVAAMTTSQETIT